MGLLGSAISRSLWTLSRSVRPVQVPVALMMSGVADGRPRMRAPLMALAQDINLTGMPTWRVVVRSQAAGHMRTGHSGQDVGVAVCGCAK
jgi:hypothetical protein